jgi:HEAT repeat protein
MTRFSAPVLLALLAAPVSAAPVPERVPDLVKTLKNGKPGERVIAAEMLADLGPKAEGAIPALVEVIRDTPTPLPIPPGSETKWTREESAAHFLLEATWDALARIGPKAVPALAELLAHKDAEIRGRAAATLATFGPNAVDAVPALIKRLGEGENQWVCSNALEALAAIGPKAEAAIPALIKTVLDPKATVPKDTGSFQVGPYWHEPLPLRAEAARALRAIGPKALVAVKRDLFPAIAKALDDDGNEKFRSVFGPVDARSVWLRFGADAAPLVPALVRHLSRHTKSPLIPSLLKLGPDGHKALVDLISDKDERSRRERLLGLCERGRLEAADLRPILPQLIPFMRDKDHYVRLLALMVTTRDYPTVPPEVVKAALPLLDDKEFMEYLGTRSDPIKCLLTDLLVELRDPVTIPKLLKDLESDDKERRAYALRELGGSRSGPRADALLPVLRELAAGKKKHPDIPPWVAARKASLISLDPKDVELLVPFWTSKGTENRELFRFVDLRHLARPHLKHLFAVLNEQDADARRLAARVIKDVIGNDPDVRGVFDKWVIDTGYDGPFVREIAAPTVTDALRLFKRGEHFNPVRGFSVVRRIGPAAKDAVPFLLPYLAGELDPVMQKAVDRDRFEPDDVLRALGAIGPSAKAAVPLIRKQLAKVEDREKTWYLLCLADIGPGAKDAVPDLKELLIDPNPRLRLLAACALSKIEADPAAYRATFARMIHDRPKCVLWDVPGVFERIAADYPELVPVVVRGLVRLDDVFVRLRLRGDIDTEIPALKRHASAAKAAVPDLVNYLNTARRVVPEFIELLGTIGPDAKAALPKLRELLDDWDFEIVITAHAAIQKIEAKK